LLELLGDRAKTEQFGAAARRFIEQSFSLRACAEAYERLYAEVLEEARARQVVA
jgi:glycosyltransferase involved in cell wall biosynthesis